MKVLVTGAGGFIGGHLTRALLDRELEVRALDVKPLGDWWQVHEAAENWPLYDLTEWRAAAMGTANIDRVYNLACDMGGIGFIEGNRAACMQSVLINTHLLRASVMNHVDRFLFASSACVYPAYRQSSTNAIPLAEDEAYPAMPEDGYGWEKLFSERMTRHFAEDLGIEARVARIHNAYGPHGTWRGGREKAPAAICRKVAESIRDGQAGIEVWGNGEQTRSFMYVDDCVHGLQLIMDGDESDPINLGSSELVTINKLVADVELIAGVKLDREYRLDRPQGVAGRNSDNTRIKQRLGWEPSVELAEGLPLTYRWVESELARS